MITYVLDACALIAYFNGEAGCDKLEEIFAQTNCERLVSIVNVFEVCYDAARISGIEAGTSLYQDIQNLPIHIIRDIQDDMLTEAIYFKITYQVSVADSMALGLAKSRNASLVTADHHEFDPIDNAQDGQFVWIR